MYYVQAVVFNIIVTKIQPKQIKNFEAMGSRDLSNESKI